MGAANHHGTLVVVGDTGVLIRGQSGSGKSTLALALIAAGQRLGLFVRLVADDQVYLQHHHGRLIGWVPQPLAGLVEMPPLGPVPIAFEPRAQVDWVVDLVTPNDTERMVDIGPITLDRVTLPLLKLPQRNTEPAVTALLKILGDKVLPGKLPL
ncbi:HPr kinase/phosphatase C-terminal domain-containing protein [Tianweitania sp. BSSL-BM11]|uniref:HPr kinase/phosphatase C-terminal domain-containing protein n=1 Tax=Tianweitania aestuarii TaxID=2814886 RepID=A0ABS5RXC5_9HYPH|nr:HPr kinase/phosphatase C-terminal domain-containing protein [Tianweitania aestuarii]MBS9721669.1 HPr kinase/phosphatase C-terminal domain-containing protein [Tianweitania aestuarii]